MVDNASRRGAANLGVPLMIVAFLAIFGFLYWLNVQARAEQEAKAAAVAEEAARAETDRMNAAAAVDPMILQTDPGSLDGETVRVEGLMVASRLGTQGFWLELPNQSPFLVSLSPAVKAEGVDVGPGHAVTVVGVMHAMSDSTLNAWTTAASITEGDRLAAEFATYFIEADEVMVVSDGDGAGN